MQASARGVVCRGPVGTEAGVRLQVPAWEMGQWIQGREGREGYAGGLPSKADSPIDQCVSYQLICVLIDDSRRSHLPSLPRAIVLSQVLWSYGARCSDDMFVYHGFCLEGNPDEDIELFRDVPHLLQWAGDQMTRMGLDVRGNQVEALAGGSEAAYCSDR